MTDRTKGTPRPPIPNSYRFPGGHVAGEYPGDRDPAKARKKIGRLLDAGIETFVDLTGDGELLPYDTMLAEEGLARGRATRHVRLPIRDMEVPSPAEMTRILDTLQEEADAGRSAYVHCWGGVGRTGTVVGCWLVAQGHSGEEALRTVGALFATMSPAKTRRHARTGSPQTGAQRRMVAEWRAVPRSVTRGKDDARAAGGTIVPLPPDDEDSALSHASSHAPLQAPLDVPSPTPAFALPHPRIHATLSRYRAALLGGAIGDALGWPVEFLSLADVRDRYGADGIRELDPGASGGPGAITDDTQMTLFSAEGILRGATRQVELLGHEWNGIHRPDPERLLQAYLRWLRTQEDVAAPQDEAPTGLLADSRLHVRRAPGNTCLGALRNGVQGTEVGSPTNRLNDSKGCGGVMRVAPIGMVRSEDPFAFAVMAASLTHGHPSGFLSAGAYALIVNEMLLHGAPLDVAVEVALARLEQEPEHAETSAALRAAVALAAHPGVPSPAHVESLGGGWTGEEALSIGVYCALVAESFEHGVQLAVNHGGDSDSTGSIAGTLLGLALGEDGIPERWLSAVELGPEIGRIAQDLCTGYGGGPDWRARYPGR